MSAASITQPIRPTLKRRGLMLILASPPGGGKTTISRELMATDDHTVVSVSATTRAPRPGEVNGEHYHFIPPQKFQDMIDKGEMMEYALVYNNHLYGTPRAPVEKALSEGKDVIFDIDWQGMRKLTEQMRDDVVSIFILPPTWEELENRLRTRAQDSEQEIVRRLGKAQEEISHYGEFQYVVINKDLETSMHKVRSILLAERLKRSRLTGLQDFISTLKPAKA